MHILHCSLVTFFLVPGSSLDPLMMSASYHVVQRLKTQLRRQPLRRQRRKFPTTADNVQTKRLELAGDLPLLTDGQLNTKNNRFFWATTSVEDMNDLPCCNRRERRRLANATDCGQKPYHNRILGGVVSKVSEK